MQSPEVKISSSLRNEKGEVWKQGGVYRTGEKVVAWLDKEREIEFIQQSIEVDLATGEIEHTYYREPTLWGKPVETKLKKRSFALELLGEVKNLITGSENPDKQKGEEVISLIQEKVEAHYKEQ